MEEQNIVDKHSEDLRYPYWPVPVGSIIFGTILAIVTMYKNPDHYDALFIGMVSAFAVGMMCAAIYSESHSAWQTFKWSISISIGVFLPFLVRKIIEY